MARCQKAHKGLEYHTTTHKSHNCTSGDHKHAEERFGHQMFRIVIRQIEDDSLQAKALRLAGLPWPVARCQKYEEI